MPHKGSYSKNPLEGINNVKAKSKSTSKSIPGLEGSSDMQKGIMSAFQGMNSGVGGNNNIAKIIQAMQKKFGNKSRIAPNTIPPNGGGARTAGGPMRMNNVGNRGGLYG